MSNLCVCHIANEWCVYCEVILPLEKENRELKAQILRSKETHNKWTKEHVWIYRNDRGDIIRAQDAHPQDAIKETKKIWEISKNLVEIDCYDCKPTKYTVCAMCNGTGKLIVSKEFAEQLKENNND